MRVDKYALLAVALLSGPAFGQAGKTPPPAKVAATATGTFTPFQLARGRLSAPLGVTPTTVTDDKCVLTANPTGWTFRAADCPKLAKPATHVQVGNLALEQREAKPSSATFKLDGDKLSLSAKPPLTSVAYTTPAGWKTFDVKDDVVVEPSLEAVKPFADGQPPSEWLGEDAAGSLYKLSFSPPPRDAPPGGAKSSRCLKARRDETSWCTSEKSASLICLDATDDFSVVRFDPKNHVLLPNQSLDVLVRYAASQGIEMKQQGTRGLYEPRVADYTGAALAPKNGLGQQGEGATCDLLGRGSFAPRTPGSADVKIELRDPNDHTKLLAEHTIELEVETTYAGAIRLGFSTIFGDAVDRAYAAQTGPGSSTLEIAATDTGDTNIEAVVSFSTYVYDLINQGGRTYAQREIASYFVPSPYIAVGIVTPQAGKSGVNFVPSLHLGLEWEFSKSFSIGIDTVLRKVTRLSDGYAIGSPVSAGTIFTHDDHEWGWSFTFTVSPEFFQFAMGKP